MTIEKVKARDDRKVDQSIEHTFPASDPTPPSGVTGTEPASRPVDRQATIVTKAEIEQAQRGDGHSHQSAPHGAGVPVDQPDRESVRVRQGTGPRETVSVLLISLVLAVAAGALLMAYFYT